MRGDRTERLSRITVAFHWVVGVGIIGALCVGFGLAWLPRGEFKFSLIYLHKSVGTVILVLALGRLLWRWKQGFPHHVAKMRVWERRVARLTHTTLIFGTLLLPISGIMLSLGAGYGVPFFGFIPIGPFGKAPLIANIGSTLHLVGGWALVGLIAFHVLAALRHHFVGKDDTLRRMLGKTV